MSLRLRQALHLVPPSKCVADIGCDHGLLCEALLVSGRAQRVVACDISAPSLAKAKARLAPFGQRAETRLADGLSALWNEEADTIVICGMGGREIIRVLQRGEGVARTATLVLGPHRDAPALRSFLLGAGYAVVCETALVERGVGYHLLSARVQEMRPPYSAFEIEAGRYGCRDWSDQVAQCLALDRRSALALAEKLERAGVDPARRERLLSLADGIGRLLKEHGMPETAAAKGDCR